MGGLGNQLFQLAFLDYIEAITSKPKANEPKANEPKANEPKANEPKANEPKANRSIFLRSLVSPETHHSKENYFQTIFKWWAKIFDSSQCVTSIEHELSTVAEQTWGTTPGTCYVGYFQRHAYVDLVRESFVAKLSFDTSVLKKYPDISAKTFVHVRGGDYAGHPLHEVPLRAYYQQCVEQTPLKNFVIFTNDVAYARALLPDMFPRAQVIDESEVNTLYLMSQCGACICANSSFSWWGACLNPERPIFMPSKWYNDPTTPGNYYFKGVTVIDI